MKMKTELLATCCYEDELIENLRDKYYYGIPLSIFLLCDSLCIHQCHYLSVQITRGMSSFKVANGNINAINEEELGNHTWVEKEEWVYDVTDGMKWRKDAYYSIYQPNIVSVYDNNECLNWNFYQEEVNGSKTEPFSYDQALMLEMIELLETENPSYNHDKLMKEIEIFRKENLISKKYYHTYVKRKTNDFLKKYQGDL